MLWQSLFAILGLTAAVLLSGHRPLSLQGAARRTFLLAAAGVNLWSAVGLYLSAVSPPRSALFLLLVNSLLMMAATDLREKRIYDIHFYPTLFFGAAGAFFPLSAAFGKYLLFLLAAGILFLAARRSAGFGKGDAGMIACLALYFPLSGWMEVLLIALLSAILFGLAGMVGKKSNLKTELPFMPFLLLGVLLEISF